MKIIFKPRKFDLIDTDILSYKEFESFESMLSCIIEIFHEFCEHIMLYCTDFCVTINPYYGELPYNLNLIKIFDCKLSNIINIGSFEVIYEKENS